ncbi:MAG TPA: hypothetical protein VFG11_07660, partial [Acidobacteriota bacterium]|nr:hypothetical protein [Acidobacteriota bacterium]
VNEDLKNDEIVVGDPGGKSVLVFRRTASGDVAPLRILQGPKTKLDSPYGIAVDPVHNLLIVGSHSYVTNTSSILIFNRTDQGNVAPRAIIAGAKTGIIRVQQVDVDPDRGRIFVAVKNSLYQYRVKSESPSPWDINKPGFIGVWDITDSGDVPPKAVIRGAATGLIWPAGVALNPASGEIFAVDSVGNNLSTFLVPQFFKKGPDSPGTISR